MDTCGIEYAENQTVNQPCWIAKYWIGYLFLGLAQYYWPYRYKSNTSRKQLMQQTDRSEYRTSVQRPGLCYSASQQELQIMRVGGNFPRGLGIVMTDKWRCSKLFVPLGRLFPHRWYIKQFAGLYLEASTTYCYDDKPDLE